MKRTQPSARAEARKRLLLVHWHPEEAEERAARLRAWGYRVDTLCAGSVEAMRAVRDDPPDGIVIDLARTPSHGRDSAVWFRTAKGTRAVPLVFLGGDPAKVARIREQIPDAAYLDWDTLRSRLAGVLAAPRAAPPVVPPDVMAGYSGTPLPRKLGIKEGHTVVVIGAPEGFEGLLDPLPEGAVIRRTDRGARDLTLFFARSAAELARRLPSLVEHARNAGLWIIWAKKTSPLARDVTESVVREEGIARGLVDFKICAVDRDWSGLRFTQSKGKGRPSTT